MFWSILVVSTNAFCTVLSLSLPHFQSELFWASSYVGSGLHRVEHKAKHLCHLPLFSIADDVNEAFPVPRVRPELPRADHVVLPQASKSGACNLKSQVPSDLLESPIPCFLLAIRTVLHARQTTKRAAFYSPFCSRNAAMWAYVPHGQKAGVGVGEHSFCIGNLCFSRNRSATPQTDGRHWTSLLAHVRHPRNDASTFFQRRPLISLLRHHRLHDELHAHTWTECSVLLEQENTAPPAHVHQLRAAFLLTRVLPLSSPTNASLSHFPAGKP